MKNEVTRETAREILKNGILNMSVARLIQMSNLGLAGSIALLDGKVFVENTFNRIDYDKENKCITFSVKESEYSYGAISFSLNDITEIFGCENEENPEGCLDINIKLNNDMVVVVRVLY